MCDKGSINIHEPIGLDIMFWGGEKYTHPRSWMNFVDMRASAYGPLREINKSIKMFSANIEWSLMPGCDCEQQNMWITGPSEREFGSLTNAISTWVSYEQKSDYKIDGIWQTGIRLLRWGLRQWAFKLIFDRFNYFFGQICILHRRWMK